MPNSDLFELTNRNPHTKTWNAVRQLPGSVCQALTSQKFDLYVAERNWDLQEFSNDGFWHIRDIAKSQIDFRFREKSGLAGDITAMSKFGPKPAVGSSALIRSEYKRGMPNRWRLLAVRA